MTFGSETRGMPTPPPVDWPTVFVLPERSTLCFPLKQMLSSSAYPSNSCSICSRGAGIFTSSSSPMFIVGCVHGRLLMQKSTGSPLICCVDESHLYRERNEVEQLGHRRDYDRLGWLRNSAQRWPHTYRASALRSSRARAYTHRKYVRCD